MKLCPTLVSVLVASTAFASSFGFAAEQIPMVGQSQPELSEDWKGRADQTEWTLGVLGGLGITNATPGFALMGVAGKKIVDQGFIPEINNNVWLETELGPVFAKGAAAFQFSAHLRWDFVKDLDWTIYALGGLGGASNPDKLGDKFEFYPRFGVGALWNLFADFTMRGEISHELIVVGAQWGF